MRVSSQSFSSAPQEFISTGAMALSSAKVRRRRRRLSCLSPVSVVFFTLAGLVVNDGQNSSFRQTVLSVRGQTSSDLSLVRSRKEVASRHRTRQWGLAGSMIARASPPSVSIRPSASICHPRLVRSFVVCVSARISAKSNLSPFSIETSNRSLVMNDMFCLLRVVRCSLCVFLAADPSPALSEQQRQQQQSAMAMAISNVASG